MSNRFKLCLTNFFGVGPASPLVTNLRKEHEKIQVSRSYMHAVV